MTHETYRDIENHILNYLEYPALCQKDIAADVKNGEAEELLRGIPEVRIALLGVEVDLLKAVTAQKERSLTEAKEAV